MQNLNQTTRNIVLKAVIKTIKGTSFLGVRDYENSKGEVSNYVLLVGVNFENLLINDFNSLKENQKIVFEKLEKKYSITLIETAYKNLYDSLEKRLSSDEIKEKLRAENDKTMKFSDAQSDAYNTIAKGIREHKDTGSIQVFGLQIGKKVIKAIEYKEVKSRELTICQNEIKNICKFKQSKFRTFDFDKTQLKIQGITI